MILFTRVKNSLKLMKRQHLAVIAIQKKLLSHDFAFAQGISVLLLLKRETSNICFYFWALCEFTL